MADRERPVTTEPSADMFRQMKPCSDCPFLREGGVRHGAAATADYASYFLHPVGATFPCHASVPKDDPRSDWSGWREGQTLCAGGLIFAEKLGKRNGIARLGIARGWYDPGKLEQREAVCDGLVELLMVSKVSEEGEPGDGK